MHLDYSRRELKKQRSESIANPNTNLNPRVDRPKTITPLGNGSEYDNSAKGNHNEHWQLD
jgi:hypothetical protein